MKWTPAERKAHGAKISASWARKRAEKEKAENDAKWKSGLGFKKEAWGKSVILDPEDQAAWNRLTRDAVDAVEFAERPVDMVNHPSHYTFSEYEVADVADAWYADEPHLWNANKYMARWNKKGDPVENIEKAIWYLKRKLNILKEGSTE